MMISQVNSQYELNLICMQTRDINPVMRKRSCNLTKYADQPTYQHSLISAKVVRSIEIV